MVEVPSDTLARQYRQPVFTISDTRSFWDGESAVICGILGILGKPDFRLLEIGTYRGCSLVQFHAMFPAARLESLNILPKQARDGEMEILPREHIGAYARSVDVQYIQHFGDSRSFDFSGLGKFDAVFIDGNHHEEFVLSDSMRTLGILQVGGVMIWHDCTDRYHLGRCVQRAVRRLPFAARIVKVQGTTLCYYIKPIGPMQARSRIRTVSRNLWQTEV